MIRNKSYIYECTSECSSYFFRDYAMIVGEKYIIEKDNRQCCFISGLVKGSAGYFVLHYHYTLISHIKDSLTLVKYE